MKIIEADFMIKSMIGAGAFMLAFPAVAAQVGADGLDIHGWRIEAASPQVLATTNSPYLGTSLRVADEGLGFTDPRPGDADYAYSPDGELGFADPRPGR